MGAIVRLSGIPVDVPDDFAPLSSLLKVPANTRLVEGIAKAITASIDVVQSDGAPATSESGQTYVATSGFAFGPVKDVRYAMRLGDIYVRETAAGGGAQISVLGMGEVVTDG